MPRLLLALCLLSAAAGAAADDDQVLPQVDPIAVAAFAARQQIAAPLLETRPNARRYGAPWILVGVKSQTLKLYDGWGRQQREYVVSTARKGVGELSGSYQTPRGWHRVCERIGAGVEADTIIFRRKVTPGNTRRNCMPSIRTRTGSSPASCGCAAKSRARTKAARLTAIIEPFISMAPGNTCPGAPQLPRLRADEESGRNRIV